MTITVNDAIEIMNIIAPPALACPGDPVGLQTGDPEQPVNRIMLCLDASQSVIAEAKAKKIDLIISHHPRFYRPFSTVTTTTAYGRRARELIKADIALFSAHSNLDSAPGGVNDCLAELSGLADQQILKPLIREQLLKLVVFVPDSHLEPVREAVAETGAGSLGEYSDCSFRSKGIGTFRGSDDSKPFIGEAGSATQVEEWRLEVLLGEFLRPTVEAALKNSHPYEEPAYEFIPLAQYHHYGLGRYGKLASAQTLESLAKKLQKATGSNIIQLGGAKKAKINKLAVWSGSGVDLQALINSGADTLVTGELGYHDCETLAEHKINLILLGHAFSERIILPRLAESLSAALDKTKVIISENEQDCLYNF